MLQKTARTELDQAPHQRVDAAASATFHSRDGRTHLLDLYQQGSAKIRLPQVHADHAEAILINTAGGLTGADKLRWSLRVENDASAIATTQACEKAYRSNTGEAHVDAQLYVGERASLFWLPQETILYESASLRRDFHVSLAPSATFLAVESIVFGREAMGERIDSVQLRDCWRVHRGTELVYADNIHLADAAPGSAQMNGMTALATLVFITPESDEQFAPRVSALRSVTFDMIDAQTFQCGFSAFGGKLTGRMLACDSYTLRKAMFAVLNILTENRLPRIWRS